MQGKQSPAFWYIIEIVFIILMPATVFLADFVISSKRFFFEFTRGFSYMILRPFVSIWKFETIMRKNVLNEKLKICF